VPRPLAEGIWNIQASRRGNQSFKSLCRSVKGFRFYRRSKNACLTRGLLSLPCLCRATLAWPLRGLLLESVDANERRRQPRFPSVRLLLGYTDSIPLQTCTIMVSAVLHSSVLYVFTNSIPFCSA
jgi:hypothetical protein